MQRTCGLGASRQCCHMFTTHSCRRLPNQTTSMYKTNRTYITKEQTPYRVQTGFRLSCRAGQFYTLGSLQAMLAALSTLLLHWFGHMSWLSKTQCKLEMSKSFVSMNAFVEVTSQASCLSLWLFSLLMPRYTSPRLTFLQDLRSTSTITSLRNVCVCPVATPSVHKSAYCLRHACLAASQRGCKRVQVASNTYWLYYALGGPGVRNREGSRDLSPVLNSQTHPAPYSRRAWDCFAVGWAAGLCALSPVARLRMSGAIPLHFFCRHAFMAPTGTALPSLCRYTAQLA